MSTRHLSQPMAASVVVKSVHRLFVYGSLREGMINRKYMDEQLPDAASFKGRGTTVEPFVLIGLSSRQFPFMMRRVPGSTLAPCAVVGEVHEWSVDDADDARVSSRFWQWLDNYEEGYDRVAITVALDTSEQVTCQCYVLQDAVQLAEMAASISKDSSTYFHVADGDWKAAGGMREVGAAQ
jgi:gamma-glutamylcyclotransferase (GGCT)/AIG2-like uncharacterized protein YtfP